MADINLPTITAWPIQTCLGFFDGLELAGHRGEIASKIVKEVHDRLRFLVNVGLDYLTLDRKADTLSGGEAQRIKLAKELSRRATGKTLTRWHQQDPIDQRTPPAGWCFIGLTRERSALYRGLDRRTVAFFEGGLLEETRGLLDSGVPLRTMGLLLLIAAGAIFLGYCTPEAAGDYAAGPSHVLPTGGAVRFASPLGVYDFQKRSSLILVSADGGPVRQLSEGDFNYGTPSWSPDGKRIAAVGHRLESGNHPIGHVRVEEGGVIRGDHDVAHHHEFAATSERVTTDGCDDRLADALDRLPVAEQGLGVVDLEVAEHVGVPADQLVGDRPRHVAAVEAQLLQHLGQRLVLDGLNDQAEQPVTSA